MAVSRRLVGIIIVLVALLASLPVGASTAATPPSVDLGDIVVTEPSGRSGTATVALPIVLSSLPNTAVTLGWRTVAGTAGTADFVTGSGTLTIGQGSSGGGLSLGIRADRTTEGTESFTVELTSVTGAVIADGIGRIEIRDAATGLAVGDAAVLEPDADGADVPISITIPSAPPKGVSFAWQLRSGSATVGDDVVAASGTGVIPKGALSAIVFVRVNGDVLVEDTETFELIVDSVKNVALADGIGVITLRDDDVVPPTPTPTPSPTPTPTPTPSPTPTPTPTPTPSPTVPPGLEAWQPPVGAIPESGTAVYLESATGDYIGQGRTYAYTLADAIIAVDPAGDRFSVHIRGDETWDGWFAPQPAGTPLTTGSWNGLQRYPFYIPGLSWYGEGRGCNTLAGAMLIDSLVQEGPEVVGLTARFEQRCTDASRPPLRGYIRFDLDDPTQPPPPGDAAAFPWAPPAGAVPPSGDYLYFESAAGDYIGQGRTELYTPANASFSATESSGVVRLRTTQVNGTWDTTLSGPDAQVQLLAGLYDELGRYPFHNPTEGGLSMSGEGRGCNELAGAFAVDSIAYDGQGLVSVEARFVQRCEITGPPLHGALRWSRP